MKHLTLMTLIFLLLHTPLAFAQWKLGIPAQCGIPTIGGIGSLNQGVAGNVNLCACLDGKCKWVKIDADEVFKLVEHLTHNATADKSFVDTKLQKISKQIESKLDDQEN